MPKRKPAFTILSPPSQHYSLQTSRPFDKLLRHIIQIPEENNPNKKLNEAKYNLVFENRSRGLNRLIFVLHFVIDRHLKT